MDVFQPTAPFSFDSSLDGKENALRLLGWVHDAIVAQSHRQVATLRYLRAMYASAAQRPPAGARRSGPVVPRNPVGDLGKAAAWIAANRGAIEGFREILRAFRGP